MYKFNYLFFILFLACFSFAQNSKLVNKETYTEFVHSLGNCIENKNIPEIKKAFLLLNNGKIVVETDHESLYSETDNLFKEDEKLVNFGKLIQTLPRKTVDITHYVQKKAWSKYNIKIEKAIKMYFNSSSSKPHYHEIVLILCFGKWFLVDY